MAYKKAKLGIFSEVPVLVDILIFVNKTKKVFITTIYKNIDVSYSYAVTTTSILEKNKLIIIRKEGRMKVITITKQGKLLAKKFEEVIEVLRNGS